MKQKTYIQFKAAFLLFIFSLNMFVGTACALGVDMGFNSHHHEEEETGVSIHTHKDGEKHHHEEAEHKHKDNDKKDDCCHDKVFKLLQTDKVVPQFAKLISPILSTAFIPTYFSVNIYYYPIEVSTSKKYYVRGHHPPIPDIRIAIQSFQI